ncbi:MAG: alpha/beta fold hydrolase [Kiritimatiellae bacterium]|nr:alpha/beta fold hydrolase [Kiritimatiellia bacterium]
MRRSLLAAILLSSLCAAAAEPARFALVRSDSGSGGTDDGVFSLDESTLRLSCMEESPRDPAPGRSAVAILCHGFAGRKESFLFDALSKAIRERGIAVARFDFNGHGESGGSFDRMTVSNEVLDVETVVDHYRHVRGARVALVGHSQGGVVAALAAGALGDGAVEALALLAPAAVLREDAQRGRVFDAVFDPLDPPLAVPVMGGSRLLGRDYVLGAQQTDPYPAVARFGGPVLVVHGQADTVVPWSCGQRFADVRPDGAELVLLRSADHSFTRWEDTVAGVVADFLAKSFGFVPPEPAEPAESVAAEDNHAESAEVPESDFGLVDHGGNGGNGEQSPESMSGPESAAPAVPVEMPPDIRGDLQAFLEALDTQSEAVSGPEVAGAAEENHAENAENAEPIPEVAGAAEENHAENAENAEPVPEVAGATEENHAENAENAELVPEVASATEENHAEAAEAAELVAAEENHAENAENAEPVPEVAGAAEENHAEAAEAAKLVAAEENHAENAENAEPIPEVAGAAEENHAESAESGFGLADNGGNGGNGEQTPLDSVQALAAALPSLPIASNGSVINILAAPNGLTWQGLEVEEEDMIDRLRIFGESIPDAYIRIQAFPETPFARVKALVDAAKDSGFTRISVVLPSFR